MADSRRARTGTALALFAVVGGMVGLSFASVPLYALFCRVTGYGGTPVIEADRANGAVSERTIRVSFDANTNRDLPWRFRPVQGEVTVRLGEEVLAHYMAQNLSERTVTGTATFNVTPFKAAGYVNKVECFCFTEQTLGPGQTVDMPVLFHVDPAILDDPNVKDVRVITLSYTFFPAVDDDADGETDPAAQAALTSKPASDG